MTAAPKIQGLPDVPTLVFETFLEALQQAGASDELIIRLRKTLTEEKKFTERALKDTVLPEESLT